MMLRDAFQRLFEAEAAKRDERRGYDPDGSPEWVRMEREAMLRRINEERLLLAKAPLEMDLFERKELTCMGHSDYSSKLALVCMELVVDHG